MLREFSREGILTQEAMEIVTTGLSSQQKTGTIE